MTEFRRWIEQKTAKNPESGCWEWLGRLWPGNYPIIKRAGKGQVAHRRVWEELIGPIPTGRVLMHSCDNRRCVNPDHLRIGTQSENMLDMHAKGRAGNRKGSKKPYRRYGFMARLAEFRESNTGARTHALPKAIPYRQADRLNAARGL